MLLGQISFDGPLHHGIYVVTPVAGLDVRRMKFEDANISLRKAIIAEFGLVIVSKIYL